VGLDHLAGAPNATQIKFFNEHEGGVSEAGIAVLHPCPSRTSPTSWSRRARWSSCSPIIGKTAQFPLETTIPVKKGDVVALTVPTWAPALALGFGNDTSWRASRPRKQCNSTGAQTTQTLVAGTVQYYCLYQTARLTYSAT